MAAVAFFDHPVATVEVSAQIGLWFGRSKNCLQDGGYGGHFDFQSA